MYSSAATVEQQISDHFFLGTRESAHPKQIQLNALVDQDCMDGSGHLFGL